ncbi:MFS transporter [Thermoanaerobacterium thermosaccharolyticum]|uniref:MFS transporter n=1 Tax=Thermoanaerobacterium thermosaccharolyticum TaxID=1517 RepID=UPI00177C3D09|nr:MFS transporter [Thermoanaerobacterium thermosaccharolyticum]MBE0067907.1 MFS transporter [Thermoanaerobacterium thermosaccharolyticum]MBE0227571.1 MFS transporter [Thermoanaerobacterium thermosaccharolyticum]
MNLSIFRKKNFLFLITGKFVSLIGSEMQNFALSLYALKITGSATKFASVLAITLVPQIVFGNIAGVIADWFDKKRLLMMLDLLSAAIVAIYAVIFKINGVLTLTQIYILSVLLSTISSMFNPTITAVIPSIAEDYELADANGINTMFMNIANLISPVIAGILLEVFNIFIILTINAISFLLSFMCESMLEIQKTNDKPEKINLNLFLNDFLTGIDFIKSKRLILNILIIGIIINFTSNPILSVGLTYISKQILKITDYQYGILQSTFAISMIASPFISSIITKKYKLGKILFLDIFSVSILYFLLSFTISPIYLQGFSYILKPYISLMIIIFFVGLITSIGNIALTTMLQIEIPLKLMGRVIATISTCLMVVTPLGQMIFGILFDKIPSWINIIICASINFVVILFFKNYLLYGEQEHFVTTNDGIE